MRYILPFFVLLSTTAALADEAPLHRYRDRGTLLDTTLLSGSPTFTISNPGAGYAVALLTMVRTRSAGTDLSMTCARSNDGFVSSAKVQICSYAGGTCTHADVTWKSATSVTETLAWEVGILGWIQTKCTLTSTSATTDTIKVDASVVTQ